ncbi:transketolase family protein [Elusimicrobiota bacterium]
MRKRCLNTVYELAKSNRDVVFLGSDLGTGVLDEFKAELPGQFLMEGVSEQHIIGMASGMAVSGKIVYINTIGSFITRRCFEQNLIDLGHRRANVRLLGSGGGVVYAPLGPTHLALEDIAIMRTIPHMTIMAPADADEMERAIRATERHKGPVYVRIAKGGDPLVTKADGFEIGKAVEYREPGDVLFVTTGVMLGRALDAARRLNEEGITAGVVHLHTIKPFDADTVLGSIRKAKAVVSLEEHTLIGGLGSPVAELIAETRWDRTPILKRVGLPDEFPDEYGSQDSLMRKYGLDTDSIVATARKTLRTVT